MEASYEESLSAQHILSRQQQTLSMYQKAYSSINQHWDSTLCISGGMGWLEGKYLHVKMQAYIKGIKIQAKIYLMFFYTSILLLDSQQELPNLRIFTNF